MPLLSWKFDISHIEVLLQFSHLPGWKRKQEARREIKVLVCSMDGRFAELLATDAGIYAEFYASTTAEASRSIPEMLDTIKSGYDIVHLFADVSSVGTIHDTGGHSISGTSLIESCCEFNVRLLWIASNNNAQGYIQGFKSGKNPINLIMTLKRNGSFFPLFLRELLHRTSRGETLAAAWQSLSPQDPRDPRHRELPATIFAAGRMQDNYSANVQ
jgi:hypothetical protein